MAEFYNREIEKIYKNMVLYDNRENDIDDIVDIEVGDFENVKSLFRDIELCDIEDMEWDKDDDDCFDWSDDELLDVEVLGDVLDGNKKELDDMSEWNCDEEDDLNGVIGIIVV